MAGPDGPNAFNRKRRGMPKKIQGKLKLLALILISFGVTFFAAELVYRKILTASHQKKIHKEFHDSKYVLVETPRTYQMKPSIRGLK
jgi:hypothetical protein